MAQVPIPQTKVSTPSPSQIQERAAEVLPEIVSLPPDKKWLAEGTQTDIVKENWTGSVREVTIGATSADGGTRTSVVKVGGETAMPFMDFEGATPNKPVLAIEIKDRRPDEWSELLLKEWGDALNDPGDWAKAAEEAGADLLQMTLSLTDADGNPTKPEDAVAAVRKVLDATGLPLMVFGPGQVEIDNELIVPIADAFKGERLLLGLCEDKNYRTIVASAMANGHLVNSRTAMDVNLAKQLNILINDMGLPLERIVMDPTTGALGYGFEYGYSVMERLRMAALQGDSMTQMPMLVTPGTECWKTKEAKVGDDVPESWGDWLERSITWETLTSVMLVESGADILTLRHPESLRRTREAIEGLAE
ncbi:MAG: acetyl-CoA decarbonylase/synthase complex subunit delta [Anaerolineae bacterium]|nr:acetyl-CoA decarbonylase/synthase complex subunit delta [Anaerolineae bacterium]MBT4311305.1 acetyl-CoA decarbonylase/synthase complex subunit delta [Anaerolineae bacterium]MBT4459685.1 acetyl-CoA decarbonylase/synthase complex subunit delta [Anaerolineae bacterium]MBT4841545.1 acetyl-CoA decarbonylase/synthase complex subunit delta [Anaerolineae bacterium]MBT6063024.1 acetyl-CoA decarbonylase/synthase complex subunit delta [Anaerolineae bacterium]